MLGDQQTITVDSAARDYSVVEYPDQGSVRKAAITDGESTLTMSHQAKNATVRHLVKVQDTVVDAEGDEVQYSAHLVITLPEHPIALRVDVAALTQGLLSYLATAGLVDNILLGVS
jgi:hypothetical protein